ncbi:tetratricopeptide repeat protein [uncultured Tateyamaria sp.]|uniref:tetratricopeptide repeat protein n=1 Tax=Tateyamaria sp. 1078 TaxID=3417464 RepID=UPI00261CD9AC|nr:tetratricopeptide repeat protein [uncultured Tateyamaria sp.]
MKQVLLCAALSVLLASAAAARPILSDSQKSYASVCLEDAEPADRLASICEVAIADAGAGAADIRVVLAGAYDRMDKRVQARALLDDVLTEDPAHTGALNVLGWMHWEADDFDQASAIFQRSLDAGATAQGFAGLASSGRQGGILDERSFLQLIDTAIAMSPAYVWAMREKAWFYIDTDRPAEAEPVLRNALDQDADIPWTLYTLGVALFDQDKLGPALAALNQSVATGDAPTYAYLYRARKNDWLENYRRALGDAERVTQDWPDAGEGSLWKARALTALGLRPAAVTWLRQFLEDGHNGFANY